MIKKRKGFTLIEVLLAAVLFTAGTIALINALNIGIFSVADLEETTQALNLAQAKMEDVIRLPFSSITSAACAPDANFPKFSVCVNVTNVTAADPKQINVSAVWSVKARQVTVTLVTNKTDE
jgi:prepilin-type N-terminal cleavage/methylation domain-containing protein